MEHFNVCNTNLFNKLVCYIYNIRKFDIKPADAGVIMKISWEVLFYFIIGLLIAMLLINFGAGALLNALKVNVSIKP